MMGSQQCKSMHELFGAVQPEQRLHDRAIVTDREARTRGKQQHLDDRLDDSTSAEQRMRSKSGRWRVDGAQRAMNVV